MSQSFYFEYSTEGDMPRIIWHFNKDHDIFSISFAWDAANSSLDKDELINFLNYNIIPCAYEIMEKIERVK